MSDEEALIKAFRELNIENQRLALSNVLFAATLEAEIRRQYGLSKEPPKGAA
jgi:hypothetical protein